MDYFETLSDTQVATRLHKVKVEAIFEYFKTLGLISIISKEGSKHILFSSPLPIELFIEYHQRQNSAETVFYKQGRFMVDILVKLIAACKDAHPPEFIKKSENRFTAPPASLAKFLSQDIPCFKMTDFSKLSKSELFHDNDNGRFLSFALADLERGVYKFELFKKISDTPHKFEQTTDQVYARIEKRKGVGKPNKPGIVPKSPYEKFFEAGSILFREGAPGHEMYIVRKGSVSIFKKWGQKQVMLCELGPGSVLGEMSLLDGAPRSATGRAVDDVYVTYINKQVLNKTLSAIPAWAAKSIRSTVSRLREATSLSYRERLTSGLVTILRLILEEDKKAKQNKCISRQSLKKRTEAIFGLPDTDAEKVIAYLCELQLIEKSKTDEDRVIWKDAELIQLLYEYHRSRRLGQKTIAELITPSSIPVARALYEAGQTRGSHSEGVCRLDSQQVDLHLEANALDEDLIGPEQIRELTQLGLIRLEDKKVHSSQGKTERKFYVYNKSQLPLLIQQLDWQKAFARPII